MRKRANEQFVRLVVHDVAGRRFGAADEGYAGEDGGRGVCGVEGLFDIEPVLYEDEGSVGV
jgi:hypothetical protein